MPKNNLPTAQFIVPMCGPPNIYLLPAEVGALKLNGIKCRVQVRLFWGWGGWWCKLFFVAQSDRLRIRSVVAAWQNLTSKKITQSERISKLRLKPNRTELEPRWWRWKWRWAGHAPGIFCCQLLDWPLVSCAEL